MTNSILRIWHSGDLRPLDAALADDVTFSSPVTDYHGRADVAHMLGLIAELLDEVAPAETWGDERATVSAFTARVGDQRLEGMVRETRAANGLLTQVTLLLRPYRELRQVLAGMAELMRRSPLPSAAR